jgi:hypothetical protein
LHSVFDLHCDFLPCYISFSPRPRYPCQVRFKAACVAPQSGFGCIFPGLHPILYCTARSLVVIWQRSRKPANQTV